MTTPTQHDLLDAILPHVAFDGWAEPAFAAACGDLGLSLAEGRAICPRGAVGLAVLSHKEGDRRMSEALALEDLSLLRIRERISHAIRLRLQTAGDREAVRRATALFALPHMAPEGSALIWGTSDAIWTALGDPSEDVNWYTKRATLSAVYGAVVLYWLGDDSLDLQATHEFIDRRIENVMQIEKAKAAVRGSPLLKPLTGPLGRVMSMVKAPRRSVPDDLPGHWSSQR